MSKEKDKIHLLKMVNLMGDKIKTLKDLLKQAQSCVSDNHILWEKIEKELNQNKDE